MSLPRDSIVYCRLVGAYETSKNYVSEICLSVKLSQSLVLILALQILLKHSKIVLISADFINFRVFFRRLWNIVTDVDYISSWFR
jgi:hypothetical protein